MTNASVVGTFIHKENSTVHTIMKFVPLSPSDTPAFFVTCALEHVAPVENSSAFVDRNGALLIPA